MTGKGRARPHPVLRRLTSRLARMAVLALLAFTPLAVGTASPAAAVNGNVTLNYGNWNCFKGGSVRALELVSIDRGGEGRTAGNRITLRSPLHQRVQITASLYCQDSWRWWTGYRVYNLYAWRWFSFNGQTTWI